MNTNTDPETIISISVILTLCILVLIGVSIKLYKKRKSKKILDKIDKEDEKGYPYPEGHIVDKGDNSITFIIENQSNEPQITGFLVKGNVNENVKVEVTGETGVDFYDYLKQYPQRISRVRLSIENKNTFFKCFFRETKLISGQHTEPFLLVVNELSPFQFQEKIIDKDCNFWIDGLTKDLKFRLSPQEKIQITIAYSDGYKNEIDEKPTQVLSGVILTNLSDKEKSIRLFDYDGWKDIYSKDEELSIVSVFEPLEKQAEDYVSVYETQCKLFKDSTEKNEVVFSPNNMKIYCDNSNQFSSTLNIKWKDLALHLIPITYFSHAQFIGNVVEFGIERDIFSENPKVELVLLPHTKVMYLFNNLK